jgi:hypothetical protein
MGRRRFRNSTDRCLLDDERPEADSVLSLPKRTGKNMKSPGQILDLTRFAKQSLMGFSLFL